MRRLEHPQIELQIAPLIDVCFLLLFFYILTSRPQQPEGGIRSALPGTVTLGETLKIPDQQCVRIGTDGQVFLNEQPVDTPQSGELSELRARMTRLRKIADSHRDTPLVLIETAESTRHQRLVDVLHACAGAGIESVTFEAVEESP